LLLQPENEAKRLALKMELFTDGSLNAFAHKTNVDVKNRIAAHAPPPPKPQKVKRPGWGLVAAGYAFAPIYAIGCFLLDTAKRYK
jgi:hypothetical protein